jgi:ADP-ribose pyrophosphatase YjhB (NUDIX family)
MKQGRFGVITGFLEPFEDPSKAVLREVGEEIGVEGKLEGLIGVYPFEVMNEVQLNKKKGRSKWIITTFRLLSLILFIIQKMKTVDHRLPRDG